MFRIRKKKADVSHTATESQNEPEISATSTLSDNLAPKTPQNTAPHEQRGKRNHFVLRSAIVEALQARPMTRHELCHAVDARASTVQKHLDWLEKIRQVESFAIDDKRVWRKS